jgi:predicted CXXCH cytochrome family protein
MDVDLVALDASAHSSQMWTGIRTFCFDCHVNQTNYRYPHIENPAQTVDEFVSNVEQNCQGCHYPHRPFHGAENVGDAEEGRLPGCADCHGSHDVARRAQIPAAMPAKCVACHVDQPPEWAQQFLVHLEGFGPGAEGYAGSDRCIACHDDIYLSWQNTLHARLIQDPHRNASVVVADFTQPDPDLTFGLGDVAYAIGSRWKQLFISRAVSDTFTLLPAQWNVATSEWVPYAPDGAAAGSDWREACGSCHVTGLDTATWTFTEFSIGCESCHGPAAAHVADPENVKLYSAADDQVCGACHSRGTSPDGHPYPATYRPGDTLADHFAFTPNAATTWPDGSARLNYQQYTDWLAGDRMKTGGEPVEGTGQPISCATCHEVHAAGVQPGQLRAASNSLCLECHTEQRALVNHMPYHEQAAREYNFQCSDCHMPRMATSATDFDIHNHTFGQPDPAGSVEHGGVSAMPNACNNCHTELGEGPDWAVEMIAWKGEWATPTPATAFGPGPTPTSPPPPTPLPSVGQPAEEHVPVATGRWLRSTVLALMGLFVLLVLWLIARWYSGRRQAHV